MSFWPRSSAAFFLVLCLVALGARLIHFTRVDLWQDEANEVFLCEGSAQDTFQRIRNSEMRPPLRYYFLKVWLLGGRGTHYLRLPSLLFSVAAVGLLYLAARKRFSEEVARMAGLIMAAASFPISSAHFCRSYGMDTFVTVLAVHAFLRRQDEPSLTNRVYYVVAATLAAYTTYFFDFLLGLMVVAHLYYLYRGSLSLRQFLGLYVPLAILTAPLLLLAPGQWSNAKLHQWHARGADAFDLYEYFQILGAGRILNWDFTPLQGVGALLCLFFAALGGYQVFKKQEEICRPGPGLHLFFWWFTACSGILFLVSLFSLGLFTIRTMIIFCPAYYLLAAAGVQRLSVSGRFLSVALLAAINIYSFRNSQDLRYLTNGSRNASDYLIQNCKEGEWVIHAQHFTYFPMRFYAPGLPHRIFDEQLPWNWGAGQVTPDHLLPTLKKARELPGFWLIHKTLNQYHHYQEDEQNYQVWRGQLLEAAEGWETGREGEQGQFLSDHRVRIGNVIVTHYSARIGAGDILTHAERLRKDLLGLQEAYPQEDEYVGRALGELGAADPVF